jgi:radical S-adenosyl methionine domain-containing protein 2
MLPAVNYHLWEPCNMRCKFCYATFQDVKKTILPKGHLKKDETKEVIFQLAEIGFEKITFAGGEPTLCPWLTELIETAKNARLTTMLITNGTMLSDDFLKVNRENLDWIALSIDSINDDTNLSTGRAITGKKVLTSHDYYQLIDKIKSYGYGFKINTVVNRLNYHENMSDLIKFAQPTRWKVLQVLPIIGQNDGTIDSLTITEEQFNTFLTNHSKLETYTTIVGESNEMMKGSYAMVDPAGRFFDNTQGKYNYSKPILEIGARLAIQQMNYDFDKFVLRGGVYRWKRHNNS